MIKINKYFSCNHVKIQSLIWLKQLLMWGGGENPVDHPRKYTIEIDERFELKLFQHYFSYDAASHILVDLEKTLGKFLLLYH